MIVSGTVAAGIVALLVIACSATGPTQSSPTGAAPRAQTALPGTAVPGTAGVGAPSPSESMAAAQLCDPQAETSLTALSGRLAADGVIDDGGFWAAATVMLMNLDALSLGPDGIALRDTARQALQTLQVPGGDDITRAQTAGVAAQALADLALLLCAPSEM